jgi:hypothetical protein
MIKLELTTQETVVLYGLLENLLKAVNEHPNLELENRANTTALIISIMGKVADEIENL